MKKKITLLFFIMLTGFCFGGSKPEKILFDAIADRKIEEVKAILPQVKNFEDKNFWGDTPLTLAIKKGDIDIVKAVVDGGANPMAVTKKEENMFYFAVKENKTDIAKYFAEKGVDVKKEDKLGDFPLLTATEERNIEIVKLILEKGENPDRETKKYERAMRVAMRMKSVDIVKLLIENKADVNKPYDDKKNTLLHTAVDYKNDTIIEILIKSGADINAKNVDGKTPIDIAAKRDENGTVFLLKSGAQYNDTLYEAVINSNFGEAFKIMMDKETRDISKIYLSASSFGDKLSYALSSNNKNGMDTTFTVLSYTLKRDSDKIMGVLIDRNYALNYQAQYQEALDTNKIGIIKVFLDRGKINIKDKIKSGNETVSQLYYLICKPRKEEINRTNDAILYSEANYKGRLPIVEELIKRGADKNESVYGKSLAEIADSRELKEMAEILRR